MNYLCLFPMHLSIFYVVSRTRGGIAVVFVFSSGSLRLLMHTKTKQHATGRLSLAYASFSLASLSICIYILYLYGIIYSTETRVQ